MRDARRVLWNENQKALRMALAQPEQAGKALELFREQHGMVHAAAMSARGTSTFEDEVWDGLSEFAARNVPPNGEHSIAWMTWHITRVEDLTMNLLAAGEEQVINRDQWRGRLRVGLVDTGNAMDAQEMAAFSASVDLAALREYRLAVGRQTRLTAAQLGPVELKRKVLPERLQKIRQEGGVADGALGLLAYWGGLTTAGLLLMPPTRHPFVHWNEALQARSRLMPRG